MLTSDELDQLTEATEKIDVILHREKDFEFGDFKEDKYAEFVEKRIRRYASAIRGSVLSYCIAHPDCFGCKWSSEKWHCLKTRIEVLTSLIKEMLTTMEKDNAENKT